MSTELYLHVGHHKTATTSLQNFLSINYRALRDNGILYPRTGQSSEGAHHLIISAIRDPFHPYFMPEHGIDHYLVKLKKEIKGYKKVLISSEILSETINQDELVKFCKEFETKIILYLRRQDVWIESLYAQEVQAAGRTSKLESPKTAQYTLKADYRMVCDSWADLFGRENIIVRVFDKSRLLGGSVYNDFLSIFQLNTSIGFKVPELNQNQSLNREELEFKRLTNFLINSQEFLPSLGILSESKIKSGAVRFGLLSPIERAELMQLYNHDNEYVARNFCNHENGQLFHPVKIEKEWKPFYELSLDQISQTIDFIYHNDIEAYRLLRGAVIENINNEDNHVRSIAKMFRLGLLD